MRWAYIGNFSVPFTTENEVARALEGNGHQVQRLQENTEEPWRVLTAGTVDADVVLWTRTGWDWPHTPMAWDHEQARDMQRAVLDNMRRLGIPTVGYHLDRWWGLDREGQVHDEPFFRVDLLCTADGGHEQEWAAAGVNHRWFPPGVSKFECEPGNARAMYASDVAFVGSWRPGYHVEWRHRPQLVNFLRATYGKRCRFWPVKGRPAVRMGELRDLYASVKVVVGDSCLVGDATRYWSDRIPETLGRGGFLLHPYVEGIEEHFTDGKHLRLWPLGDFDELRRLIDHYVTNEAERRAIAEEGRRHVLETATYSVRMQQLEDLLRSEGLL